jgi:hypothetical protein
MNLNPLSLLEDAINEHGSAVILAQRLELVKEMLAKIVQEKADLEKQLSDAKTEIQWLKTQIPQHEFVAFMGARFKRKPSGGYENAVYCQKCDCGMASMHDGRSPFICTRCNASTSFHKNQLSKVLEELAREYPSCARKDEVIQQTNTEGVYRDRDAPCGAPLPHH